MRLERARAIAIGLLLVGAVAALVTVLLALTVTALT